MRVTSAAPPTLTSGPDGLCCAVAVIVEGLPRESPMSDAQVIWDDEPGGNVGHVAQHGLTPDEVDEVLLDPAIPTIVSRSSGRRAKFGWTSTGKFTPHCGGRVTGSGSRYS